jgi:hypothetical protein
MTAKFTKKQKTKQKKKKKLTLCTPILVFIIITFT